MLLAFPKHMVNDMYVRNRLLYLNMLLKDLAYWNQKSVYVYTMLGSRKIK